MHRRSLKFFSTSSSPLPPSHPAGIHAVISTPKRFRGVSRRLENVAASRPSPRHDSFRARPPPAGRAVKDPRREEDPRLLIPKKENSARRVRT